MHSIHAAGWSIHHHGDWSGDAIITRPGIAGMSPEEGITIPGAVLVSIAASIFEEVAEAAENLTATITKARKRLRR